MTPLAALIALMRSDNKDKRVHDAVVYYVQQMQSQPRAYYIPGSAEHPFDYGSAAANTAIDNSNGYFFKFLGPWNVIDPLTGEPRNWRQWHAITGENAWLMGFFMDAYQYLNKNYSADKALADEALKMARQIADAMLYLQMKGRPRKRSVPHGA